MHPRTEILIERLQKIRCVAQHGADRKSRQEQGHNRRLAVNARQPIDQQNRAHGPREGQQRGCSKAGNRNRRQQKHSDRGAQQRSAGRADDVRVCQRIAKQPLKKQAGDGESAADQNGSDDPRKTDGKQNDALIFRQGPQADRALHQGPQGHTDRAHAQGNEHGERERGKQHCQQPKLPAIVVSRMRVRGLVFPGLARSYFQGHDSPPKVNFIPMRKVNGNDG